MQPPDHVVVGTGFTGLLYATLAVLKGESVLLYEKRNRSGGLIGSVPTPFGLVETAANGILNSYRLEELAFALNLDIISAKKNSKQRFIWKGGNPKRIPLSFSELLRLLYGALTISAGIRPEESVYQWGVRVLGKGAVENLLEPGLAGIYAGNLKDMSAELVLGRWISSEESLLKNIRAIIRRKKTEQKIPKGRRGIVSFRGGLGELLTVMETKIKSSPNSKILYSEESPTLNSLRKKYPKAKIVLACGLESSLKLLSSSFPVFKRYEKICKTLGIVTATRFGNRPLLDKKRIRDSFPSGFRYTGSGSFVEFLHLSGKSLQRTLFRDVYFRRGLGRGHRETQRGRNRIHFGKRSGKNYSPKRRARQSLRYDLEIRTPRV